MKALETGRAAVLGLGIIGSRAAARLAAAGWQLKCLSRTPKGLAGETASPEAAIAGAAVISIYLKDAPAVRAVMERIAPALSEGQVVLNHATVDLDTTHWLECSRMRLLLGLLGSAMCLCQCSCRLPGRADGIDPNPFTLLEQQATAINRDPARIVVPVLRAPVLEKRWGAPRPLVGPKGGYALRYQDPSNEARHVTLFGSPDLFPTAGAVPPPYTDLGFDAKRRTYQVAEVSQRWQVVAIAGRPVRFYISQGKSGGEPLQISTETFRLTAPDGRTASYRIRVSSPPGKSADGIENLLRTAAF